MLGRKRLCIRCGFLTTNKQILDRVVRWMACSPSHCVPQSTDMSGDGTGAGASNSGMEQSEFVKQETLHRAKWLSLEKITYKDPKGEVRTWEMVERTTNPNRTGVADAVAMVAVVKRLLHYDCVLLVRQFRPPLKGYTIEFPAGLIDHNETPAEAAIRELKEETGYVGTITSILPVAAMDPGISATTLNLAFMQIDGEDPANQRPTTNLDDGEFIEVILAPLAELLQKLNEYSAAGDVVDSRVYTYAATFQEFHHHNEDRDVEQQKGLFRK